MVLGIISEKNRMNTVSAAEAYPKYVSPNKRVTSAPTPAAPTVCDIVFNVSMADKGLSILFFKAKNDEDHVLSFSIESK